MTNEKSERLYLYLARRDKTDIRVLTVLNGPARSGRVDDIAGLSLNASLHAGVQQAIYENRMYWEPWIDPAASYTELRNKLFLRGFKSLPFSASPIVPVVGGSNAANTSSIPKKETMMRRSKA